MKEVKCPKCDSLFEIDASGYADIVKQIRGDEFETELNIRLQEVESKHDMKLELAQQSITSEKDKEILKRHSNIFVKLTYRSLKISKSLEATRYLPPEFSTPMVFELVKPE